MSNPYTYTMLLVGAPTNKELLYIAREEAYPSNPFFCGEINSANRTYDLTVRTLPRFVRRERSRNSAPFPLAR